MPCQHASHLAYLSNETYHPDNMTPLYDAIGIAVNKFKAFVQKEVDYNVLVTILTDGEENASKEYSYTAISALIKEQKAKGWVFTYIGANHDVEKTAMSLNINNHLSFQTNEEDTNLMFNKVRSSRVKYMKKIKSGSTELSEYFFKEEKNDS